MTYLCLDYGLVHTGIAINFHTLAEPIATVLTQDLIPYLSDLISKNDINAFVVGLSEGEMGEKTKTFTQKLKTTFNLPVFFQDETLTSYESRVHAAQSGKKRKARHQKLDHLAAAQILQDFLDTQKIL